ncbi:uncharacterized protein B0I36DRAFT_117104 [Microdochium trichocladiopsis]|uniref:Uncharacterized protein n=1 Tax=Microdochium trichocladiopsis TaxID=1682393 RepID=A0A9P8Y6T6_9PEZI|nr:uncharacterized protein B0I36DRAFT_117104 [Microdochium trichocladiopsis]KAH7030973.1 hypothetical protein B0I36DRAFT_117104 [Microdochium trichocladiopsis]
MCHVGLPDGPSISQTCDMGSLMGSLMDALDSSSTSQLNRASTLPYWSLDPARINIRLVSMIPGEAIGARIKCRDSAQRNERKTAAPYTELPMSRLTTLDNWCIAGTLAVQGPILSQRRLAFSASQLARRQAFDWHLACPEHLPLCMRRADVHQQGLLEFKPSASGPLESWVRGFTFDREHGEDVRLMAAALPTVCPGTSSGPCRAGIAQISSTH